MSTPPALEAFYEELAQGRWIEPDAELEAMTPGAARYLEERFDEHVSAVNAWLAPGEDPLELTLWVTRSAHAAAALWSAEWDKDGALRSAQSVRGYRDPGTFGTPQLPIDLRWRGALEACDADYLARTRADRGERERDAMLRTQLRRILRSAAQRSSRWQGSPFARDNKDRTPSRAAFRCARDLLVPDRADEPRASPWAPLMALWNRGCWPFALRGGTLGVFVPPAGALGIWPTTPFLPRSTGGSDPVSELLGFGRPALHLLNRMIATRGPLSPPDLPEDPT